MLIVQLCLALCDPMDCNSPGSSVHGILQERLMEWVYHSFFQGIFPTPGIEPGSPTLQADSTVWAMREDLFRPIEQDVIFSIKDEMGSQILKMLVSV